MTVTEAVQPGPAGVEDRGDERLAYRGPIQRLLVRPEIGALIGAAAVWAMFWAVTIPFGTAAGTANYLDVSATLGIMSVAVALLMIGGEFDLSSGAMTGATGILVILLVKHTGELGGAGLSLWLALPLSFLIALGIGWFNGALVERTSLPSFIVTLGTFFMLKGGKLGFSKMIIDNVQVGRIDEGSGYSFWRKIFASEWTRNSHLFEGRDTTFSLLFIGGALAILLGVIEMTYSRRAEARPQGLGVLVAGIAAGLGGFIGLLATDGTGSNLLFGGLTAVGFVVAALGWGRWRYEDREPDSTATGGFLPRGPALYRVLLGLASVGLATFFAFVLDSESQSTFIILITVQGLRAILFVSLALVGLVLILIAAQEAGRSSARAELGTKVIAAAALTFLAFVIRAESQSVKFRAELFTVLLWMALIMATSALLGLLYRRRTVAERRAEALGRNLAGAGITLTAAAVAVRLLFSTAEEVAATKAVISFRISILWFLVVAAVSTWVLLRTRFGSWIFAVGGNKDAARSVGVPAARTKTTLFMIVAAAAWLVGMLLAFRLNTLQAGTGDGLEFQYIIAAVVGGSLLTGGYGSAAGGAIGALIMAMSFQGIPFAGWNSNWKFLFLGVILLLAVIVNNYVRTKAEQSR